MEGVSQEILPFEGYTGYRHWSKDLASGTSELERIYAAGIADLASVNVFVDLVGARGLWIYLMFPPSRLRDDQQAQLIEHEYTSCTINDATQVALNALAGAYTAVIGKATPADLQTLEQRQDGNAQETDVAGCGEVAEGSHGTSP
jgi:ABC-type Co2+ transport system permease subunit